MDCKKKSGQARAEQINYLFTGFYNEKNQHQGKLKPLTNITFAARTLAPVVSQGCISHALSETIEVWSTNHFGAINLLLPSFEAGHRVRMLTPGNGAKAHDLYFPSPEELGYLYAAKGQDWSKILYQGFPSINKSGLSSETPFQLIRQTIAYDDLEKPLSDDQLVSKLNINKHEVVIQLNKARALLKNTANDFLKNRFHEDIIYRSWFNEKNKDDKFHGYIIQQSRFVIFTFSNPQSKSWRVNFWPHQQEKNDNRNLSVIESNGAYLAIYRASPEELCTGLYHIEISSPDFPLSGYWGKHPQNLNSYTLIEKFRFEINNLAGDFEIINCDPITVEEGLFKQHTTQFSHLLKASITTDSDNSTPTDSGLAAIAHDIKTIKTRMDYIRGVLNVDGQRKGMKSLGTLISKTLAQSNVDVSIIKSIDLAFNINEYRYEMFDNLKDTYRKLNSEVNFAGDSLTEIISDSKTILKDIWSETSPGSDPVQQQAAFNKTFAGYITSKFKLPEAHIMRTLNRVDFLSGKAGTALDIYDTVQMADKYFYEAISNLDNKNQQMHDIFFDYHKQIGEVLENDNPLSGSTFKPNEKGELSLKILFAFDRSDVQDTAISVIKTSQPSSAQDDPESTQTATSESLADTQAINEVAQLMQAHPEVEVLLEGHTDPVGNEHYNLKLSLRRANAVKEMLVNRFAIDDSRISVKGSGENDPVYNDQGEVDHDASRRVVALIKYLGTYRYAPSREGIANLEQVRHATVLAKQGHDQQLANLAAKAWDWILMVGAAHPYVRLLSAITVTYDMIKNALALVDDLAFEHFFQTEIAQYQQLKSYHSSSNANQILLRDTFEREHNDANMLYLQSQFRVRAEALNGLVALITRAAIGASDLDDYLLRFQRYQISAYIDNFLLNDGWQFALKPNFPLTMDEYWTYAVNGAGLISEEHYSWFGFDKDFHLTDGTNKATLTFIEKLTLSIYQDVTNRVNAADALINSYESAQHAYSRATSTTPQYERADFQRCFPIHHLSSDNFSALAKTFITNFDFLGNDIYEHTAIYARGKKSKDSKDWQYLNDWRQRSGKHRPLSALDQIRILVVLKNNLSERHNTFPASIQLIRTDGLGKIDGPVYKTLIRPLVDSELLAHEKHYRGRIGCIVHPIYQFGQVTFNGTKPFTTDFRLSLGSRPYALPKAFQESKGFEQAWDYWRSGGLDEMCYQFQVRIADSQSTQHTIRVTGTEAEPDGEYEVTVRAREMLPKSTQKSQARGRRRRKFQYRWLDDAIFLYAPFLKSRSSKGDYPELFGDNRYLTVLIRVGGEQGHYLTPNSLFEDDIHNVTNQQYGMKLRNPSTLKLSNFDWDTSIEFMFIASAANINLQAYKTAQLPWTKLPLSTRLIESTGRNTDGPKIQTTLSYLGKLKKQGGTFSSSYQFETDQSSSTQNRFKSIIDLLSIAGDKANIIGGAIYNPFLDDERFIYAGYYRCQYENLLGLKINSIRPFSQNKNSLTDRVSVKEPFSKVRRNRGYRPPNPPFKYAFAEVESAGQSLNQDWIVNSDNSITEFHFNAPDSYFENVPWVKEPGNKDELLAHAKKYNKETLLLEWTQKSKQEKKKSVKHWIEQDTQSIKQFGVKAIRI